MTVIARRKFLAIGACGVLSACSLPRGAAQEGEILKSAQKDALDSFAIYQVTRDFLPKVSTWPATGKAPLGGWIEHRRGSSGQIIAPGDYLDITVWDSDENSLLASPASKMARLENMRVAPNGTIFMPYLDAIEVSGMTPQAARAKLQDRMVEIAPSAQVQLNLRGGPRNSVDLVGGVAQPGSYPLPSRDMTVLSLISAGGGVSATLENPIVRLIRGGKLHVTNLGRLYENPRYDTTLVGGDKVIIEEDPRSFVALGATGTEQLVQFAKADMTALDAIASMGGISDNRADPKGILVLREYPQAAVGAGKNGPDKPQTIFVLDLTTADGLFGAKNFTINPDDVVYASESPLTNFQSIAGAVGSVFGIARTASSI